MYTYRISVNAKEDLKRIYAYGIAEFGEHQADEYYFGFFETFELIASHPLQYQTIDHIRPGYRRCPCLADTIYYRINGSVVEIMAILGGQDVDSWL